MKGADKERVVRAYREAYMAANGTEPTIFLKAGGWYQIGTSSYRLNQLQEMTERLKARVAERDRAAQDGEHCEEGV